VAKSGLVRIENRDKLEAETTKDPITGRCNTIIAKWDIHSVDVSSYDYIAVYKSDSPNYYYITYKYIDIAAGAVSIEAPRNVGKYQLRYHSSSQSKYVDCARSQEIEIINTDSVTAENDNGMITIVWNIHSQPKTKWDWVGLFKVGASNTDYMTYKYVDLLTDTLVLDCPQQPGKYEVRYFSSLVGKYESFRSSVPITI